MTALSDLALFRPPPMQAMSDLNAYLAEGQPQGRSLWELPGVVAQSFNELFVQPAIHGLMAPGNALLGNYSQPHIYEDGTVRPYSPALYDDATSLAGLVSLGAAPIPRPEGSLGMGGNYLRNLGLESPFLWRDMSAPRALDIINRSIDGPFGQEQLYWASVPDLAIGQNGNTGIRMRIAAEGVQGLDAPTSKPGLEFLRETGGGREFMSRGGVDFRNIDEIAVQPTVMFGGTADDRLFLRKLREFIDSGQFKVTTPDGFVTVYNRIEA